MAEAPPQLSEDDLLWPALDADEEDPAALAAIVDAADQPSVLREVAEQTTYGELFLADLIRRQRRLSLSVAGVFLVLLFGLPLANLAFPAVLELRVLGLPIAWLLLGVLVYPLLWLLAWYFTTTAREIEDAFTDLVR